VGLFSDGARLTNPPLRLAGDERQGRDGARRFWEEYHRTLGLARSEFEQITVNERAAGLFWTTRLQGETSGGPDVAYDGASLLVFDDQGAITRFAGYFDTRELGREIGLEGEPSRAARP
jgi:hypothetical protein